MNKTTIIREIKVREFFDINNNILDEKEYYIDNDLVYEIKPIEHGSTRYAGMFHNMNMISDKEFDALCSIAVNFRTDKNKIKPTINSEIRTAINEIEIKDYYYSNGGLIKSEYCVNNELLAYKIFKQQRLVYKQIDNLSLNHEEHLVYRKIFIKNAEPDI